jgi:hypothetical protein
VRVRVRGCVRVRVRVRGCVRVPENFKSSGRPCGCMGVCACCKKPIYDYHNFFLPENFQEQWSAVWGQTTRGNVTVGPRT